MSANKALAEAVERLARAAELQLQATREQIADARRREAQARHATPEFQAEMEAIRRPLRKFSAAAFVRAAPQVYGEAFGSAVPGEFFTQVADGTYLVACPCGTDHVVDGRGYPSGAECGRTFMYDGDNLRVAFTPSPASGDVARP